MFISIRSLLILMLSASSLTACKMVDNMNEMHDATVKMATTTDKMASSTLAVDEKTDQQRQAVSSDKRDAAWEHLKNEEPIEAKFEAAATYMYALEFQAWRGKGSDTQERRESMYKQAVEEFFNKIKGLVEGDFDTSPTSGSNERKMLYALSAALHRLNPEQVKMSQEVGFEAKSMLDVIQDGLSTINAVNKKGKKLSDLKPYENKVQVNGKYARFMLGLRANFLAASPIAAISNIEAPTGFWGTIGLGGVAKLFRKGMKVISTWEADYAIDLAELAYQSEKLDYALKTREFLKSSAIPFEANSSVIKIYKNMRERDQELLEEKSEGEETAIDDLSAEQFEAMKEFQGRIDQWISFDSK